MRLTLAVFLALVLGAEALTAGEEANLLLDVSSKWTNWDAALSRPECGTDGAAWSRSAPPCGSATPAQPWRGVTCSTAGQITQLDLSQCGLRGTLPAALASLSSLATLDLSWNELTGGIPEEFTAIGAFGALATLQLARNNLTGGLDDFTPKVGGFIASLAFNISHNQLNLTTIPGEWYSKTLQLIDLSWNNISGILPMQWGLPREGHEAQYPSGLPSLARLALEGNNISGPAEPWPAGGTSVFAPTFLCTARPGNPFLIPPARPPVDSGSGGLSGGAIAGIVVGSVAAAAALAAVCFVLVRRRRAATAVGASSAPSRGNGNKGDLLGSELEDGKGSLTDSSMTQGLSTLGSSSRGGPPGAGSAGHSSMAQSDFPPSSRLSDSLTPSSPFAAHAYNSAGGSPAPETDPRQLPADWNMVEISQLELAGTLGKGSFGTVVLARYCQTTVAVKMLGGDKAPGATDSLHHRHTVRELGKEVAVMSKLRHTNVCLYMGACLSPPCLVMEHCSRGSLDLLLSQGLRDPQVARHLRWPRLLTILTGAARGMLYLHTRQPPVYHRDLKSANLLVNAAWQAKVCDFNLSKLLGDSDFMSTQCIQNPRWLAPELLAGHTGGLAADVYAFGTVLYECMTWRAPFEGVNPYQIIGMVLEAPNGSGLVVPPPEGLPAGKLWQYDAFVTLMQACWERDPAQRPTFADVAEQLRVITNTEMRQAGITPPGSKEASAGPSPHLSIQPPPPATAPPAPLPAVLAATPGPAAADAGDLGKPRGSGASSQSFEQETETMSQAFEGALRGKGGPGACDAAGL